MKLLLMGLVVLASLTTSLLSASSEEHLIRHHEDAKENCRRFQAGENLEHIEHDAAARDEWADTYLAAEKAVAVYWRLPIARYDCESGKRIGHLKEVATPGETIRYVCDGNYGNAESGGCVPADRDYDCDELRAWGLVNIPVHKNVVPPEPGGIVGAAANVIALLPGGAPDPVADRDWMLLDDDHDGLGCEFQPE